MMFFIIFQIMIVLLIFTFLSFSQFWILLYVHMFFILRSIAWLNDQFINFFQLNFFSDLLFIFPFQLFKL